MNDLLPILVPDAERSVLTGERDKTLALKPTLVAIAITDAASEQFVADFRARLKERVKDLEEKRKTITGPLDQAKRAVDALFRPVRTAYEDLIAIVDTKLREHKTLQLAAERAAQKESWGTGEAVEKAPPPVGLTYVEGWEVEDFDLALVPVEFRALDLVKVREYCKQYKNSTEIPPVPGLTFRRSAKPRAR